MTDNLAAVTTFVHCVDCNSTVHPVSRPGGILAIEVEHSTPCPAWPHDRREIAIILYGQAEPEGDG